MASNRSPVQRPAGRPGDLAAALAGVRALILDADGVLLLAGKPLPGAVAALERLEAADVPYRVVTNYSLAHRSTLAASVSRQFGRPVSPDAIITAASSAAAYTADRFPGRPLLVLAGADALREWDGQRLVDVDAADDPATAVDAVVIGDAGDELSFTNLDVAFRRIRAGAAFVAMHRNRWWLTPKGPTLDSGALIIGLEAALGRPAIVTGKPSPVVFREAVLELATTIRGRGERALRRREVAMVGDDLDSDVAGARRIGLRGILVHSGKTDAASLAAADRAGRLRGPRRPDGVGADLGAVVAALLDTA